MIKLKSSTSFLLGTMIGGGLSMGAYYLMNKETADKNIKKAIKDTKNMIEKNIK